MRTNPQLKIVLTGVLIAFAALTIVAGPAQVMSAGLPERPNVFAATRRVSVSPQAKRHSAQAASMASSVSFVPVVTYNSGGFLTTSVAVADVNGDGKPDLVAVNESTDNIGVLLTARGASLDT